jgi:general secretion pathway protein J
MKHQRNSCGFTLIEIIVAVAIMALVSVIAYRGLAAMLTARERITSENQQLRDLAQAMARVEADFSAAVDRPIRDSYGVEKAAFLGAPDGLEEAGAAVVLTRMGAPAHTGKLADLQRVGYRVKENRLEMMAWPALDQPPRAAPGASTLLENVTRIELRYLDSQSKWQTKWPQLALGGAPPETMPRAVQFVLTLASGASYTRVIALQN